jgi:Undecaprenyl-phosphate galactose phosphotransferase WbaP
LTLQDSKAGSRNTDFTARAIKHGLQGSYAGMPLGRWLKSRRRLLVVLVLISSDILLALAIWQVAFVLQSILGSDLLSVIAVASIVPNVMVWVGLRAALGLYPGYGQSSVEELRRQTIALLCTLSITVMFAFASQLGDSLSRLILFSWSLGLLLVAPMSRYLVKRAMMKVGLWGKPVVILGSWEGGARMSKVLQENWQLGFRSVGVFDDPLTPTEGALESVPYGGTLTGAVSLAREHGVDTAIFAMPQVQREHLGRLVNFASTSFRYIIVMPDLNGITNSVVVARDFAGDFGVEIKHNLLDPAARRVKRGLDMVGVLVGGLLLSPLLLAIFVLIKLDSPGPAVFVQKRPGLNGKTFKIFKFRTMYADAEQILEQLILENPVFAQEFEKHGKLTKDPRITRIGRFLRKTSLDELPQLWNVLRGEMSLVGPRPYLFSQLVQMSGSEALISRIAPGISGLWQVSGRSETTFEQRVDLDVYYVRNWSVWLDLVILVRTVGSVLFRRGAY